MNPAPSAPAPRRSRLLGGLGATGRYLWSGWTGVASVLLFVAAWDALARQVGPLVLPTPQETLASLGQVARSPEAWRDLGATARRALTGYGLSVLAGAVLGMAAGSALLHLGGMALGHRVMQRHQLLARLAGAATAVLGVALLTRLA